MVTPSEAEAEALLRVVADEDVSDREYSLESGLLSSVTGKY